MGRSGYRLVARGRVAVGGCVAALVLVVAAGDATADPYGMKDKKGDAWSEAVSARASFEAEPAGEHTKAEYAAVMDNFRAIYHGNPGDAHAARAIAQDPRAVAEGQVSPCRRRPDGRPARCRRVARRSSRWPPTTAGCGRRL